MSEAIAASSMQPRPDFDLAFAELHEGSQNLQSMSISQKRQLVDECIGEVARVSPAWVAAACQAKRISADQPIAAEEILAGPATLLRYLQLLSGVLRDIERDGKPHLPGKPRRNCLGQACVPILPVRSLYDQFIFGGLRAEVWLQPLADGQSMFSDMGRKQSALVAGVLGAGNVSAIPATDMLFKIFHDGESVLLKLNPVNEYLESIFAAAFRPLVEAKLLRLIRGGREIGIAIVEHPGIDSVHITGSHQTHDAIVWGATPVDRQRNRLENKPAINKSITSELGNVTPWIVVPGRYSSKQLRSQAEHLVASITVNASFNCLSTRMIVTSKQWPQRKEFLDLVDGMLQSLPPRFAYYPGAIQRFEQATGRQALIGNDQTLPWTLLRDTHPKQSPQLFMEESFVCVCAETALDESSDTKFLGTAVDFVNECLFGTLCATITVANDFRRRNETELEGAIARLRYGSVCINQWSGVVYGMMTPPWGGHPSATVKSPQSGIGHVHNTFCLRNFDKTVLWGPLRSKPKPVWLHSHKTARQVAWELCRLYEKPTLLRLPKLFYYALRG